DPGPTAPEGPPRTACPVCGSQAQTLYTLDPSALSGDDALFSRIKLSPQDTVNLSPDLPNPNVPGYEVLETLGRGGMGVVYKARQVGLNRIVALKMVLAGSHAGETELTRFRTEAEAVARLQHPNIVHIYEIGVAPPAQDGRPYMVLEYVSGGSLEKQLAGQPQPALATAEFISVLARAIHEAHQAGIIHRDLKPSNILLQPIPKSHEPVHKQTPSPQAPTPRPARAQSSALAPSALGFVCDVPFELGDFSPN